MQRATRPGDKRPLGSVDSLRCLSVFYVTVVRSGTFRTLGQWTAVKACLKDLTAVRCDPKSSGDPFIVSVSMAGECPRKPGVLTCLPNPFESWEFNIDSQVCSWSILVLVVLRCGLFEIVLCQQDN